MVFEEKILAYLDGSLDPESSAELLHTLSVSPEKRALLEEHLKLRELISLGQKPMSVPFRTEQMLGAKLPMLVEHLPYLTQGAASYEQVATGSSLLGSAGLFLRSLFTEKILTTGLVAGAFVAGGLTWFWMSGSNNNAGDVSVAPRELSADRAVPSAVQDARSGEVKRGSGLRSVVENSFVALRERGIVDRVDGMDNTVGSDMSSTIDEDQIRVVSGSSFESVSLPVKIGEPQKFSSLREIAMGNETRSPITAQVNFATGATFNPQVGANYSASALQGMPTISVAYDLNEHVALGIEAGVSRLTKLTSVYTRSEINEPSLTRGMYSTGLSEFSAKWACAMFRYSFNPMDALSWEASAGAGAAFAETLAPQALLGASGNYALNDKLCAIFGVEYRAAWFHSVNDVQSVTDATHPIGIVHNELGEKTIFSPSAGVRFGLRFRP
jgi:hypothetical protein